MVGGQQLVLTTVCEQFSIGIAGMDTMVAVLYGASMLTPSIMGANCGFAGMVYPMFMGILVDSMDIHIGFIIWAVTALIGRVLAFFLNNSQSN